MIHFRLLTLNLSNVTFYGRVYSHFIPSAFNVEEQMDAGGLHSKLQFHRITISLNLEPNNYQFRYSLCYDHRNVVICKEIIQICYWNFVIMFY